MRTLAFILIFVLTGISAFADDLPRVVSRAADATALTIYPDNLALITETRTVDLPIGKSTIVFEGVSDRMISASAMLREFSGFTLERNFDYALLDKANLFEKSVGEFVTITRTHKKSGTVKQEQAKIISAGNGVVFDIDGRFETLQCSALSEGVLFDNLPEGLSDVPELSIDVETETAGPQQVVISYLADNFSWESDYRLDMNPDEKTAKLNGWLTISNQTSQSFVNAPTAVIAGRLNRNRLTQAQEKVTKSAHANCWPRQSTQTPIPIEPSLYSERKNVGYAYSTPPAMAPMVQESFTMADGDEIVVTASRMEKRQATQEDFGDYKLYRTAAPVTVAAYQTKQVIFIAEPEVELAKFYTHDFYLARFGGGGGERYVIPAIVEYRLDNSRDGKLAKPLPKGTMRVLSRNADEQRMVIGETKVVDTAIDNPMKIYMNPSSLVQVQTSVIDVSTLKIKGGQYKYSFDIVHAITNATNVPANVEIKIDGQYKSLKFSRESHKRDTDVGPNAWPITVPANETVELKYKGSYIQ